MSTKRERAMDALELARSQYIVSLREFTEHSDSPLRDEDELEHRRQVKEQRYKEYVAAVVAEKGYYGKPGMTEAENG